MLKGIFESEGRKEAAACCKYSKVGACN